MSTTKKNVFEKNANIFFANILFILFWNSIDNLAVVVYVAEDGQLSIKEIVDNIDVITQHSIDGDELIRAFSLVDRKHAGYLRYVCPSGR